METQTNNLYIKSSIKQTKRLEKVHLVI